MIKQKFDKDIYVVINKENIEKYRNIYQQKRVCYFNEINEAKLEVENNKYFWGGNWEIITLHAVEK